MADPIKRAVINDSGNQFRMGRQPRSKTGNTGPLREGGPYVPGTKAPPTAETGVRTKPVSKAKPGPSPRAIERANANASFKRTAKPKSRVRTSEKRVKMDEPKPPKKTVRKPRGRIGGGGSTRKVK